MTNPIPCRVAVVAACLAALALAAPAKAQSSNGAPVVPDNGHLAFQSGLLRKAPKAGLPDVAAPPQAWPRLDPGAVLCNSESDLDRLAARHAGEDVPGPIDCQFIRSPTAIKILQRVGPGKQEV